MEFSSFLWSQSLSTLIPQQRFKVFIVISRRVDPPPSWPLHWLMWERSGFRSKNARNYERSSSSGASLWGIGRHFGFLILQNHFFSTNFGNSSWSLNSLDFSCKILLHYASSVDSIAQSSRLKFSKIPNISNKNISQVESMSVHKYAREALRRRNEKANFNKASTDVYTMYPRVSNNGVFLFSIAIMVFLSLSFSLPLSVCWQ